MSMSLQVVSIQSLSELLAWRDALKTLHNTLQTGTFCTDPDWHICWLKHYLSPKDRIALTLHLYNGELVAAYPLYQKKMLFGYELRFIGTGEPEQAEVCSEFQDFMILPDYRASSLMLFNLQTTKQRNIFQITLDVVQQDANCQQWLKQLSNIWYKQTKQNGLRYTIPVATDELEQINHLPHQSSRRHARKLLQMSDIVVEQCSIATEIPGYFNELIQLHNQHWHQQGKDGAFATEQFRAFHFQFAKQALEEDKLLMFRVVVQQQSIAVFYGFYSHDRLFYYQSGISRHAPIPSAGIAMHLIALRFARQRGKQYYDLMKGKSDSYKTKLVNSALPLTNVTAHHLFFGWVKVLTKVINRIRIMTTTKPTNKGKI